MKLKLSALQCLFFIIHVSVGKLFAYLINGIQKSIVHRRETKTSGISESGQLPRSPFFGGSSCQGTQLHSGRQKPHVDVQHHKYLVESCQFELKLEQLILNTQLCNLGNKSLKTASDNFPNT